MPVVRASAVALLGPRDLLEIDAGGAESVRDRVAYFADEEVAREDPGAAITAALAAIDATAFWLHVDLDVLTTEAFAAVDYPQPGGLEWPQLDRLAAVAISDPRCSGLSVVIYNPDRDVKGIGAGRRWTSSPACWVTGMDKVAAWANRRSRRAGSRAPTDRGSGSSTCPTG